MNRFRKFLSENKVVSYILLGVIIIFLLSGLAAFQSTFAIFWYDSVAGLGGFGAISATFIALWLFKKTSQEVDISQQQVGLSQLQTDAILEQTKNLVRPVLYPSGVADGYKLPNKVSLDDSPSIITLAITQNGSGIAFNVQGAYFSSDTNLPAHHYSNFFLFTALPPNLGPKLIELKMRDYKDRLKRNQQIRDYTLAPSADEPKVFSGALMPIIGRLTLTYQDIFDQNLCSIFDLNRDNEWIFRYQGRANFDLGYLDAQEHMELQETQGTSLNTNASCFQDDSYSNPSNDSIS